MFHRVVIASLIPGATTVAAVGQADLVCDHAGMTKRELISDSAKKEMATKEMAMAKEAMAGKCTANCKTNMENAMKGKEAM